MKQVHRVDDQRYVGCILSRRIGELLLRDDGVFRQDVGPAPGPGIGEIAVDTADAGLADLGDLLEQSIRDLGRSIVGINQDGETGRTEL
ncbi:hypothetical protein ACVWWG_005961 [Bradyrhizobium sp. LB7.2]